MIKNLSLDPLVSLSSQLTFSSQSILMEVENEIAKGMVVSKIDELNEDTQKYLALTSLPFMIGKEKSVELEKLWPVSCKLCSTVVRRKTVPTGNINPRYMIIGDAPGVGDGELLDNEFHRAWVFGRSSHLLRVALLKVGIYNKCWFTNLLKCSTPENRDSSQDEQETCKGFLQNEINVLRPEVIILLGHHVKSSFDCVTDARVEFIRHPSFFVYTGRKKEFYQELKEII